MPTRYLKPGVCDSEAIDKCSALAEVLFYRLLVNVDDFGRMDARPALVKSKCFPIKEDMPSQQVDSLLAELSANGLVTVYQHGDKRYLQMLKWDNTPRAAASKCPEFDDTCIHLYANVYTPHTNLPVTVTVTETETVTEISGAKAPSSGLQANTDPAPIRLNGKKVMVEQVMAYLNLQARRNYRVTNPNGTPTAGALVIEKRLKEGYTVDQCKDVIAEKSNQWMGDEKMDQYLNPQTLFRKSNFDKYLTEAEAQQ